MMKMSSTKWAAAALVLALGLPVCEASAAAPGLSAPPRTAAWRGHERRAVDNSRRDAGRDGDGSAFETTSTTYAVASDDTPASLAPPVASCPPPPWPAYRSTGPRIIEIGARDAVAPPDALPEVIYGDYIR
jgi:hypothetical protein